MELRRHPETTDQLAGENDVERHTVFDEVADVFLADEVTQIVEEPALAHLVDGARSLASKPSASDRIFRTVAVAAGGITVAIMLAVGLFLAVRAGSALQVSGIDFLFEQEWSPETGKFGIAAVLFGTVTIAVIAITIALPLSLGTSLLISEVLRGRVKQWAITVVDLMAAVPSVVFGLWGLFFLQENVIPVSRWISTYFSWIPIFAVTNPDGTTASDASAFTSSAFIAGIVVSLMIVPTQTSIMREAFMQAPPGEREAAYALGSTRWSMITTVVLPFGRGGIVGGTMLGLGRALGETMAVALVLSASGIVTFNLISSQNPSTIAANIALNYANASGTKVNVLIAGGLVLFLVTFAVNFLGRYLAARGRAKA